MTVLITGAAGFIGFHAAQRLLAVGHEGVGFYGMTSCYDISLKRARPAQLSGTTPTIDVAKSVRRFFAWYREFYGESR